MEKCGWRGNVAHLITDYVQDHERLRSYTRENTDNGLIRRGILEVYLFLSRINGLMNVGREITDATFPDDTPVLEAGK